MSDNRLKLSEATKDYQPGDVILTIAEPLVHVTKYEHRLFTCEQCLQKCKHTIVCPVCQKVYYCSTLCQNRAWQKCHRLECSILSRHKPLR